MASPSSSPSAGFGPGIPNPLDSKDASPPSHLALLDIFFPGFSTISAAIQRYTHVDLNVYIPLLLLIGAGLFAWQYCSEYFWRKLDSYFMSKCSLRTDDEAYNYVMAWIAKQKFSMRSRRFIVNTNTDSRSWFTWKWRDSDDEENEYDGAEATRKPLSYTPDFGSHYFIYKSRLLIFHRSQNRDQPFSMSREEISISCFGRDPSVLKDLLIEARDVYLKRDEKKTSIYRGSTRAGSTEPTWQRCMARTSRPFSTVILNENVKKDLIDDVTDYLDPATRRWYSNRGIPYRRGYLLHGPPGTGKSSLSLALAGFFKMRIYIVSLSSIHANEETLATLFAELPRRCVVLLEDIDSAGLTHTREDGKADPPVAGGQDAVLPGAAAAPGAAGLIPGRPPLPPVGGRLSLSGLLNILDGVASQEGRVLIMTTNHIEKLDKALIRPGRVDMTVHFGRADADMTAAIFRAIYAPLEGEDVVAPHSPTAAAPMEGSGSGSGGNDADGEAARKGEAAEAARLREAAVAKVSGLAEQFAAKIPAHEFSPAELQGFLMKNKRDPEAAVANAEEWVVATRKEKKEKELQEAEERRQKEEQEKQAAAKKAKEEQEAAAKKAKEEQEAAAKKAKEEEKAARKSKEARRKGKASKKSSRKADREDSSLESEDSSDSSFESEAVDSTPADSKKKTAAGDVTTATEETKQQAIKPGEDGDAKLTVVTAVATPAPAGEIKTGTDSGYEE